jgi:hypothetical protein
VAKDCAADAPCGGSPLTRVCPGVRTGPHEAGLLPSCNRVLTGLLQPRRATRRGLATARECGQTVAAEGFMRSSSRSLAGVFVVGVVVAACGGKVDDPTGSASADQQGSGSGASDSAGTCKPAFLQGGGGGVAGGACLEMNESASCGSTTYTVQCTCPGPCDCIVNGQTVDTAATTSCSKPDCPLPDDAWKTCGFPAVAGMP